jgi:hypothetical protein
MQGMVTIELQFPSERTADFMRHSLADAFRGEGFFIRTIEGSVRAWQIRKEETVLILRRLGAKLELSAKKEQEAYARLMLMESLVDFQEFADSLRSMQEPEMMGANLLMRMFASQHDETEEPNKVQ